MIEAPHQPADPGRPAPFEYDGAAPVRGGVAAGVGGGVAYWRRHTRPPAPGSAPLMMVHGLGSDHVGLHVLTRALAYDDIIEVDLPGFGQSPPLPGHHTITAYAEALDGLCTHLGLDSVHLVGHSLGADIALAFAGLYPQRVRTVALLHPVTASRSPGAWLGRGYYRIATWLPQTLARGWLLSRPAIFVTTSAVLTTRDRERRRQILDHDYRTAVTASPRAVCEAYLSLVETSFADLARRITAPTLLVTGGRDSLAPPQSVAALHRLIAISTLVVIDGVGHLWPVEEPQAAAEVVARNLEGSSAPE